MTLPAIDDVPTALIEASPLRRRAARQAVGAGERPVVMAGGRRSTPEGLDAFMALVAGLRSERQDVRPVFVTGAEGSQTLKRQLGRPVDTEVADMAVVEVSTPTELLVADVFITGFAALDDEEQTALTTGGVPLVAGAAGSPELVHDTSVAIVDLSDRCRDRRIWRRFLERSPGQAAEDLVRGLAAEVRPAEREDVT